MEIVCKGCGYEGTNKDFGKPCPDCEGQMIAHFNQVESEIAKILQSGCGEL